MANRRFVSVPLECFFTFFGIVMPGNTISLTGTISGGLFLRLDQSPVHQLCRGSRRSCPDDF